MPCSPRSRLRPGTRSARSKESAPASFPRPAPEPPGRCDAEPSAPARVDGLGPPQPISRSSSGGGDCGAPGGPPASGSYAWLVNILVLVGESTVPDRLIVRAEHVIRIDGDPDPGIVTHVRSHTPRRVNVTGVM